MGIWEWHFVRGELRLCRELVAEAMEFARRLNDPGSMMEAFYMAGQTMLYRADFAGARDRFATAVAEFDDRERTKFWAAQTGHNAGVNIRCNLAVSLWHLGYPDQALEANREVCQLAREIGHPFSLAYCLHHTGWLYQYCRLGAEVQAAAEEEIAIATEQGFALWHATGTFFKGAGMLLQGRSEESLPLLLKGLDAFRATGAELLRPFQLSVLGDAYTQAARFEEAHAALDEGLAVAEKNDDRLQEAELHRLKGELLLAESPDQAAAAEDCFTPGHRDGPAPAEQGMGAAGHDESRPPLAAAGAPRRSPPDAGRRSRHVHRRSDDAGPRGSRRAAGTLGLTSIAWGRHNHGKRVGLTPRCRGHLRHHRITRPPEMDLRPGLALQRPQGLSNFLRFFRQLRPRNAHGKVIPMRGASYADRPETRSGHLPGGR